MMTRPLLVLTGGLTVLSMTLAAAQGVNAGELTWGAVPNFLPAGAQIAVLDGDPAQAVPITLRLKLPAGYQVPAHWHPTHENVTVLSGSLHVGMGAALDRTVGTVLKAGGFVALAPRMNHFVWTDEATVLQVHLNGPFQITYADPAQDPRH